MLASTVKLRIRLPSMGDCQERQFLGLGMYRDYGRKMVVSRKSRLPSSSLDLLTGLVACRIPVYLQLFVQMLYHAHIYIYRQTLKP